MTPVFISVDPERDTPAKIKVRPVLISGAIRARLHTYSTYSRSRIQPCWLNLVQMRRARPHLHVKELHVHLMSCITTLPLSPQMSGTLALPSDFVPSAAARLHRLCCCFLLRLLCDHWHWDLATRQILCDHSTAAGVREGVPPAHAGPHGRPGRSEAGQQVVQVGWGSCWVHRHFCPCLCVPCRL